jgi:hypothetical protein
MSDGAVQASCRALIRAAVCCLLGCGGDDHGGGEAGQAAAAGSAEGAASGQGSDGDGGAAGRAGSGGAPRAGAGAGAGGDSAPGDPRDAGTGDAATDDDDAGTDPAADWEPLATTATPACNHPPVADDFSPAMYLEVFQGSNERETGVVDFDGRYVSLRCPEHFWASHSEPSPDRRKVLYTTDTGFHVTSFLLDGVFKLPTEVDGLRTGNYFWVNDDYLVTDAIRQETAAPFTILDRALVLVRWDGAVAKRLDGAIGLDPNERDNALFWGANDRYGVYQLDADRAELGFEYYRVDFPALTSTPLVSGIGVHNPRVENPFDPETGHLLIASDPDPVDYENLFYLEVDTGELVPLESYAAAEPAQSPDGEYAVWRISDAFQSQPLRPDSEPFTYEALHHTSLLVFDPDGHRFASTTDDDELVIVDPETGSVSAPLLPPIEAGTEGIYSLLFAPDGSGVYFVTAPSTTAEPTVYYAPLDGPALPLAPAGEARGVLPSPDGRVALFYDGQAANLVGRDGSVREVRGPVGIEPLWAIAWSSTSRTVLLGGTDLSDVPHVLLWNVGDPRARSLTSGIVTGFGGAVTSLSAVHSLLR